MEPVTSIKKNSLKKKCAMCNINVGIYGLDCKCLLHLCIKHMFSESHNCTYDYKTEQLKKLELDNPKIVSLKLGII